MISLPAQNIWNISSVSQILALYLSMCGIWIIWFSFIVICKSIIEFVCILSQNPYKFVLHGAKININVKYVGCVGTGKSLGGTIIIKWKPVKTDCFLFVRSTQTILKIMNTRAWRLILKKTWTKELKLKQCSFKYECRNFFTSTFCWNKHEMYIR